MIGCEDAIGHTHHCGNVQRAKEDGSADDGNQMLSSETDETPPKMMAPMCLLDSPNDTHVAAVPTAGTFCAVSALAVHCLVGTDELPSS